MSLELVCVLVLVFVSIFFISLEDPPLYGAANVGGFKICLQAVQRLATGCLNAKTGELTGLLVSRVEF